MELAEPIRQVGSYQVNVRFMWDLTAPVTVHVKSDVPEPVEEPKAAKELEAEEAPEPAAAVPEIDEAVEELAEEVEAEIEEK